MKECYFTEQGAVYDEAYEDGDEGDTDIGEHKSVIMSLLGKNLEHFTENLKHVENFTTNIPPRIRTLLRTKNILLRTKNTSLETKNTSLENKDASLETKSTCLRTVCYEL